MPLCLNQTHYLPLPSYIKSSAQFNFYHFHSPGLTCCYAIRAVTVTFKGYNLQIKFMYFTSKVSVQGIFLLL